MECLHLFKVAKFSSLKMHVLCKVGKNIIFQNKTFLAMFYRQNKTFWYQFCNFKHFLKAETSEDSLASSWHSKPIVSSVTLLGTIFLNLIKCITACGITPFRVYFRMREFTLPRIFPHVEIPEKTCIPARFFPVEIHESACKLTCGNSLSRSNFLMWKYTKKWVFPHVGKSTIFGVFPHAEMHDLMWISTWGKAYFRRCGFTHTFVYFYMR